MLRSAMRICPECNTKTEASVCPKDGRPTIDASVLTPRRDPLVGVIIDNKYRIERRLGAGGFGSVYLARHTQTDGPVCIKILRADLMENTEAVKRFYVEAQNTHRLQHHNTVRISDFGKSENGSLFLAMEYVDGETLGDTLKRERMLPAARVVHVTEQILKSLGEAHHLKIVHRDIKPANIMLTDRFGEPDFVKVLDFGISRSLDTTGLGTRGFLGTPKYMSPEQCKGGRIDARSDLYSLGCMMYKMLSARSPFNAEGSPTEQAIVLAQAHIMEAPIPLLDIAPGVCPQPLADLIMRLLAKEVDSRPSTANEVLQALRQIKAQYPLARSLGEPAEAETAFLQTSPSYSAVPATDTGAASVSNRDTNAQIPKKRWPVYLFASLLALSLVAVAAFLAITQPWQEDSETSTAAVAESGVEEPNGAGKVNADPETTGESPATQRRGADSDPVETTAGGTATGQDEIGEKPDDPQANEAEGATNSEVPVANESADPDGSTDGDNTTAGSAQEDNPAKEGSDESDPEGGADRPDNEQNTPLKEEHPDETKLQLAEIPGASGPPTPGGVVVQPDPPPVPVHIVSLPKGAQVLACEPGSLGDEAACPELGRTPFTLSFDPNSTDTTEVWLQLEGHEWQRMEISATTTVLEPVTLAELPSLRVQSRPSGATVSLNNEQLGRTPFEWTLPMETLQKIRAGESVVLSFRRDGTRRTRRVTLRHIERNRPLSVRFSERERVWPGKNDQNNDNRWRWDR